MTKKASEFQEKVMSLAYRGKEIFKPMNTGWIDDHVACVREYVANIFFYRKNGKTIMIDAGYNYPRLEEKMAWLGIDPDEIDEILITHQDTDHVGAVEHDSEGLFRNATLYIGEIENRYLEGAKRRVYFGFYPLPQVQIPNEKVLLHDGDIFQIGDITVECFHVPGHTWGHMVYLIDGKYLFTGDTIWLGPDGGRSFIHALAEDNRIAVSSLRRLERRLNERNVSPMVITGHTGYTKNPDFAFRNREQLCNAFLRQKPHDPTAPYDAYDERDDVREKAETARLEPVPYS